MLTHCTSGCLGAAWHLLPQPPGHLWTGDESGQTQTPPPGVVGAMQGPALSCPCSGTHTATSFCLSGLRALKETLVPPLPSSLEPTSGRVSTPPNLGLPLLPDLQVPPSLLLSSLQCPRLGTRPLLCIRAKLTGSGCPTGHQGWLPPNPICWSRWPGPAREAPASRVRRGTEDPRTGLWKGCGA